MKELGEYLKSTRISNGVGLEEAATDLDISTSLLENIEKGNTRAFNDIYDLKEYIKSYANYLGIDADKVSDEFNDFLFEHTSKISLDDIREAQKSLNEKKENKIKSPYTMIPNKKFPLVPVLISLLLFIFLILLIYLIISNINKAPERSFELISEKIGKKVIYELTY